MLKEEYILDDFFFSLPENLIAQFPEKNRDNSRLFVLHKTKGTFEHKLFNQIDFFFNKGDVIVLNDAKVIHARIYLKRITGGRIEFILTKKISNKIWFGISNRTKKLKIGEKLYSVKNKNFVFKITDRFDEYFRIEANRELSDEFLKEIGEIPLPPYIKRASDETDDQRYQTVYADKSGSIAAPTAGLHFSEELLKKLKSKQIIIVYLTLHVSWDTFRPVRVKKLSEHNMHSEEYFLSSKSAEIINRARKNNKKIISVGTTTLRVLEATYKDGINEPGKGETDIFIYPPLKIKSCNALITNFHTPYSTLLMLVSAFAGYENIMKAYDEAVKNKYRFFSYGDSMIII